MSNPHQSPAPGDSPHLTDSLDAMNMEMVERDADTTPRPITPEQIAAVKRFWERQGRKPPPPWDKL